MANDTYKFEKLWQIEFLKTAQYLLDAYNRKITQHRLFNIEKKVNTCLLAIRQNYKYISKSNGFVDTLELTFYPIRDIKAKPYNFGERYNMLDGKKTKMRVDKICDYFIHAQILSQFVPTTQGTLGFFYASDHVMNQGLYYMQMCKMAQIFKMVSIKRTIKIEPKYNESNGKYSFIEEFS